MHTPDPVTFPTANPINASCRAAILLAKSAMTNVATEEMSRLAEQMQRTGQVGSAAFAFSEQGSPSLRTVLLQLCDARYAEVWILPCLIPMEPGFQVWIAQTVQRWKLADADRVWPVIKIGPPPASTLAMDALMQAWGGHTGDVPAVEPPRTALPEGSIVPPQKWRVLVCQGGPCNNAGAAVVWGHLRNEQKRLDLRTTGAGMMSAKSSCLGPCRLAPVLQVFPEGTYYGGIDESGVDRIIEQHILGGAVVTDLAYAALPGKQRLRILSAPPTIGCSLEP